MIHTFKVDESNSEYFKSYMPVGILDKIKRDDVHVIGAAEDSTAIGAMVVRIEDDAIRIIWLFITEQNRRRGVASLLLSDLEEAAIKNGKEEIGIIFSAEDSGEIMSELLDKHGYQQALLASAGIYKVNVADVKWEILANAKTSQRILSLADTPDYFVRAYSHKLSKDDSLLLELPIIKSEYLPFSRTVIENGEITGMVLYKHVSDSQVELSFLRGDTKSLPVMVRESLAYVKENYPPETSVSMISQDEKGVGMFEKLAGNVQKVDVFIGIKKLVEEV